MSTSIKKDASKQKWEETEFPLVCETCLGDNPYVRMTKETHGKKCKICEIPFTVFAWQAGTRGRLKKVEICRTCARSKNVCQVCIYDLQYGLPVQVRDKILAEEGCGDAVVAVPQSDANRSWMTAQAERNVEQGVAIAGCVPTNDAASMKLQSMARMEPRYERNLPKLCSFFAKGECNRGSLCPFRHEAPRDRNDPLSKQNTKDRFFGNNDPVASGMMKRQREKAEKRRAELIARGGEGDERAVSTLYVRFADEGGGGGGGGEGRRVVESEIRDKFYAYGEISSVRMHADRGAFVEFTTPQATQHAIAGTNKSNVGGRRMIVNWARVPKRGAVSAGPQPTPGVAGAGGAIRPIEPPGGGGRGGGKGGEDGAASAAGFRASSTLGIPRPGGGVIRRAGASSGGDAARGSAPYYPSSDPGRLGSRTTEPST
jgi:pre-mRNA-splicing factor RBM22/SLT11